MEFGLQFFNRDFQQLRDLAQAAEQLGYDLFTIPDHVVYEEVGGAFDPHTKSWDQMIAAAVVLEATRKIRVGHLVLCNLFRHPVMTAQSLTSLDHIGNGRAIAGLGAGWTEREFRMTGIAFPDIATRLKMLEEALTCIRSLWTREQTTFQGEFYRLQDAILWPKPVQHPHPPILLGGGGRGLLRIAAKHADYVNIISEVGSVGRILPENVAKMTDQAFREKVNFVREQATKNGRAPDAIKFSNAIFAFMITNSAAETEGAAQMMSAAMGIPAQHVGQSPMALIGTPEQCAAELGRRAKEWGVSQFIFSGTNTAPQMIERLAKEVLPRVSA